MKYECGETLGDLESVYDLSPITSEFTLPEAVTQKCGIFVEQVVFSYGESPRTPPLEGTSLHRRNNSVERPWGKLSLFTTCLHYKGIHLPEAVTHVAYVYLTPRQKTKHDMWRKT